MFDIIANMRGEPFPGSDQIADISFKIGGSGANQAVWLSHLGNHCDFHGCVFRDDHDVITKHFNSYGVIANLQQATEPTGKVICLLEKKGERSFITDRGANNLLNIKSMSERYLDNFEHLHISGHLLYEERIYLDLIDLIKKFKRQKSMGLITMDVGSASFIRDSGVNRFIDVSRLCDLIFLNSDEFIELNKFFNREAKKRCTSLGITIVKNGAKGAYCLDFDGKIIAQNDALSVKIEDTIGAGDAFFAGFMSKYLYEKDINIALDSGAKMGSICCGIQGSVPRTDQYRMQLKRDDW